MRRRSALWLLLGLWFKAVVPVCTAQTAQPIGHLTGPVLALDSGEQLSLELPAGERRAISFSLCAGCFAEIEIEQVRWMVSAYVDGPEMRDGLPRATDAGLHSVIHIPLIAPTAATYRLEIAAAAPNDAKVLVMLTNLRPALAPDRDRVAASTALARAEWQRRAGGPNGAATALAEYDAATADAHKAGDARLEVQSLLGRARVFLYRTGDYRAGLKTALDAIALTKNRDSAQHLPEDVALQAFAWKILSSAYAFLALYPQMIDATDRSVALYERLGDLYWQGILVGNEANVYLETGDMEHALSTADRALDIAREIPDVPGIAFSQATLGMIHQQRGEYQAAFDADHAALNTLQQAPDADEKGQVLANLAELYDELNDLEREQGALRQSLPLLRQAHDTANESMALCDLGLLDLRLNHIADAGETLRQAMQITSSHDLQREQAAAFLREAQLLAAEHRSTEALLAIRSGLALTHKTSEVATSALLMQEQGDIQARRGEVDAAMASYKQAESIWMSIPNLEHAALARASIARLEARSGSLRQAHNDILLALAGFESSRRNVSARSLRESYFASVHDFYDLAIDLDMQAPAQPASVEEAFGIAERARARSLMDAVRSSSASSTRNIPHALIDEEAAIEKQVVAAEQAIYRLRLTGDETPALERASAQLHALVLRADDIEGREREVSSPSLFSASARTLSLADIRAKLLQPGDALLEYWAGRQNTYLWIVTQDSLRGLRLCSASALDAPVRSYLQAMLAREESPANEDLHGRATRIAEADREAAHRAALLGHLLLPLHLPASVHRLIVAPDGVLASVPFAALRIGPSEYLVQRYELVEEPSASVAVELLDRPAAVHESDRIAVFADPVYNHFDPRFAMQGRRTALMANSGAPVLRNDTGLDLSALPRLNGSTVEAHAIASIAGSAQVNLWLGFEATPQQVMQLDWRRFSILHFATHAIVDDAHPELSGIVLSTFNANGVPQDGILWLHDIYRTPMPASLVFLDGCRTVSGKPIPGEGISGLAQAFLSSGASSVAGSLWSIDDTAAGKMIPRFYQALLDRRLDIAGALRSAQIRMLTGHRPPYDWAGYVVEGNWRAGISSRIP